VVSLKDLDQGLKQWYRAYRRDARNSPTMPPRDCQQVQLVPDDPAMVGEVLATYLARTASFPNGMMNPFDTITVDTPQQGWAGSETARSTAGG